MPPGELRASGWAHGLSAKVLDAGDMPTYVSGDAATFLDSFVVSDALLSAVIGLEVVQDSGQVKQHRPVQLKVTGLSRDAKVQRLRKPRSFPVQRPTGCNRRPPEGYEQLAQRMTAASDQAEMDSRYGAWVQSAEVELMGR